MEAKLYLEGEVGPRDYGYPVNFGLVNDFFQENKDAESYRIELNGPGGDAYEGMAIARLIERVAANKPVTTVAIRVASIMTGIYLAGTNREAAPGVMFMIHNPWTSTLGDADEHEKQAKQLREVENSILDWYEKKTGTDKSVIKPLMKEETFLSETQLLDLGFVHSFITPESIGAEHLPIAANMPFRAVAKLREPSKENHFTNNMSNQEKDGIALEQRVTQNAINASKTFLEGLMGIKAIEVAISNGNSLKVKSKEAEPQIGDSVSMLVDGKSQKIEDGEYENTAGDIIFVVASGKISDIMRKVAEETIAVSEVENVVAKAVEGVSSVFSKEIEKMQAQFKEAQDLIKNLQSELETAKQDVTKAQKELTEVKAGVSSTYAPVKSQQLPGTDQETVELPEGVTLLTLKDARSQIKAANKRGYRPTVGVK